MPAPPGAADVRETFGCISENNGGLGPLPALGGAPGPTGLSMNDIGQGLPAEVVGPADITAVTNSFQNGEDELVFMLTYDATVGVSQSTAMWSYNVGFDILNLIPGTAMAYNYSADLLGAKNYCCFPFMTLVLAQPELVFALAAPSGPNPNLFTYPNVGTSTVFSSSIITSDQTANGTSIGHQGRMLVIAELQYGWPVAISTMPNESFNYTDPALFLTWPMQKEVFGPENPFGFGAVNSVSAGELFCVKRRGGAIIIQGDLNNPTVTTLPGVKSTGQQYGRTDTDQNGMYYAAEHAGAWVWNGGNTSQKISNQLEDDFYLVSNPIEDSVSYAYYFQRWGNVDDVLQQLDLQLGQGRVVAPRGPGHPELLLVRAGLAGQVLLRPQGDGGGPGREVPLRVQQDHPAVLVHLAVAPDQAAVRGPPELCSPESS